MALDDDIRILERVRLLEDFTPEQLRLLAFGAETMRLKAGRDLYAPGAAADCAFVVATGTVELYREAGGRRHVLGTAGPDLFVDRLAAGLTQAHGKVSLHFFPFGGIAQSVRWIEQYRSRATVISR